MRKKQKDPTTNPPLVVTTKLSLARKSLTNNQTSNKELLNTLLVMMEQQSTDIGEIVLDKDTIKQQLFLYVREENGNLLLHYLCSITTNILLSSKGYREKLFAILKDILANEELLPQVYQQNKDGHTPLFLAFANQNGLFFTQMAVRTTGVGALTSILEYLQDDSDITEFVKFLRKKPSNQKQRILDVIYAQNPNQLALIDLLGNTIDKSLMGDEATKNPIFKQTIFFITELIKKGTDFNWQDCLQLMLNTINSTETTQEIKDISLQIFYSFINGLKDDQAQVNTYLRQKIDSGEIKGYDCLALACKYGNAFVAQSLLEKQDPHPISDLGIAALFNIAHENVQSVIENYRQSHIEEFKQQERGRRIRDEIDAKNRELEQAIEKKRIKDQKIANVSTNLDTLCKIVAEKQQEGKWQGVTINEENLDVLLDNKRIFTLKKGNLEEQSLTDAVIENFNTKIEEKIAATKKQILEQEAKHKRMVSQCCGIGLLISILENHLEVPSRDKNLTGTQINRHSLSSNLSLSQL